MRALTSAAGVHKERGSWVSFRETGAADRGSWDPPNRPRPSVASPCSFRPGPSQPRHRPARSLYTKSALARFAEHDMRLECGAGAQVSRSHVEANVPPTSEFDADLSRDLRQWFTHRQGSPATVRFEMLRRGATQSGVAYPKYYAWVEVQTASAPHVRGAVRVAAVERDRFEVLQFLSADEIRARPDAVQSVFPAALVPDISRRASQP